MLTRLFKRPLQKLSPAEAYNLWAAHYPPHAHTLLMQIEEQAILARLPDVRAQTTLDLACGTGRYAQRLATRGAHVIGVDFSYAMLARAEKFPRAQGDLLHVPLATHAVHLLVCGLAIGHVPDLTSAVSEMARVLKPGGYALYSDLHPRGAELGWQRDFVARGKRYAVEFFPHSLATHERAAQIAGLTIEAMDEISVDENLARTNSDAARFRERWHDTPVVLVVRARKNT